MLISPLAKKLCQQRSLDPTRLRGTGPRGRIMACDCGQKAGGVTGGKAAVADEGFGHTAVAAEHMTPTRPEKEGYFVYDCKVDMRALADISLPIAVQCDKLLTQGYSLMDYILRAVVKSCSSSGEWMASQDGRIELMLFENCGKKVAAIENAAGKTIFKLSREVSAQAETPVPAGFVPNIIVCDAKISREQVAAHLEADTRPSFAFVVRGQSSKVGIRVGCEVKCVDLEFSFYVNSSSFSAAEADRVAARLNALLFDPVSLLML